MKVTRTFGWITKDLILYQNICTIQQYLLGHKSHQRTVTNLLQLVFFVINSSSDSFDMQAPPFTMLVVSASTNNLLGYYLTISYLKNEPDSPLIFKKNLIWIWNSPT